MSSSKRLLQRQQRLPAAYYRGGTSRAVIFKTQDLPPNREQWATIFRGVIGSPDPYGRQLDGMGGGISSLSKVCVVGPSSIGNDADVDYTFAAIGVKDDDVDYSSNCGNMSAAIGPYAVDSGLVKPSTQDGDCVVNIHNTNTGKIIRSTFPLIDGEPAANGDFTLDGVAGTAAPVRLDFLYPGGSKTGKLLPTGQRAHSIEIEGSQVGMTCIDVGNPCVFVKAEDLLQQDASNFSRITPQEMEENQALMEKLDHIRRTAGVKMGLGNSPEDIPGSIPKIAMVWAPQSGDEGNICVRALSVGQPHKAVPVTVALSLAAAAQLPGTVAHACTKSLDSTAGLEIRHPTGSIIVDAVYDKAENLESAAVYRTARRLMEGTIFWK